MKLTNNQILNSGNIMILQSKCVVNTCAVFKIEWVKMTEKSKDGSFSLLLSQESPVSSKKYK